MAISCGRRSVSETSSGAGTTSGSKRMLGPRSFNRGRGAARESLNYDLFEGQTLTYASIAKWHTRRREGPDENQ
jgi:hypothetical protein